MSKLFKNYHEALLNLMIGVNEKSESGDVEKAKDTIQCVTDLVSLKSNLRSSSKKARDFNPE